MNQVNMNLKLLFTVNLISQLSKLPLLLSSSLDTNLPVEIHSNFLILLGEYELIVICVCDCFDNYKKVEITGNGSGLVKLQLKYMMSKHYSISSG
jgi:hypothetical protein